MSQFTRFLGDFGQRSVFLLVKNSVSWARNALVHDIYCILDWIHLHICNYTQDRRICCKNSKYAPFFGHFCPRRKAANFCHPVSDKYSLLFAKDDWRADWLHYKQELKGEVSVFSLKCYNKYSYSSIVSIFRQVFFAEYDWRLIGCIMSKILSDQSVSCEGKAESGREICARASILASTCLSVSGNTFYIILNI